MSGNNPNDIYYAMAEAYQFNSNLHMCVKAVMSLFSWLEEHRAEDLWHAIDAYVDLNVEI